MSSLIDPPPGPPPAGPPPAGRPPAGRPSAGPPLAGPSSCPGGERRHRVVAFVDGLAGALDSVEQAPAWAMTAGEQAGVLVDLARQQARLEALRLRVLAAADRNQVGAASGATSTPAWLAHQTKATRAGCFADLHLAQKLDDGFEATRQALAAGGIDAVKARIVVGAVEALTGEYDDLPADTRPRAEAHLLELASRFDPPTLRALGKRLFEVVCPEAADQVEGRKLAAEEERARRLASLSLRENGDGTTEGRFRLPALQAAVLKKALEALTSPRRLGEQRLDPATGKKLPHATLMGQGLMDLVENHLNLATVETGHRISAGEARRLACKAGLIPMVLDGDSVPLDLGRSQRLFDRYQKIALNHRYQGCAAHNCDRPPAWMEYHHTDPWSQGGRTDLANGIALCPPHHHMADHPESYDMHRLPDGTVRFTRRT